MKYLLYGANGYTGKLIIEEGLKRGHDPILAGRNEQEITALAEKYKLDYRVFSLDDSDLILENLMEVPFVLNAAGPFVKTAMPLVNACLEKGIHYLDITGEIAVFEEIKNHSEQAKKKNIMLLPGVGFDVVPTDCMASFLADQLPDADSLELAFTTEGSGMSHGTATTAVSQLGQKGFARINGRLESVAIAHKNKEINFGEVKRTVATIPWGDVSTAYTSTGIPDIDVYTAMPKSAVRFMKMSWLFNPIMRSGFVKKMAQKWVDKNLEGPGEEQQNTGFALIYGKVSKEDATFDSYLRCPEVYRFTALASCLIIEKVANGLFTPGYQTPSLAYGWELIKEIEGCTFYNI